MKLTEKDIASIEPFGELNGKEVKLLKTKGGFHIVMGMRPGSHSEECLAAGSHPGICRFSMQKQFKKSYAPAMMKSALYNDAAVVESHSHFLSDDLRKSGHEIHSIHSGDQISFHISKCGIKVADVDTYIQGDILVFPSLKAPKIFARGLAGAATEKASTLKISKLKIEG